MTTFRRYSGIFRDFSTPKLILEAYLESYWKVLDICRDTWQFSEILSGNQSSLRQFFKKLWKFCYTCYPICQILVCFEINLFKIKLELLNHFLGDFDKYLQTSGISEIIIGFGHLQRHLAINQSSLTILRSPGKFGSLVDPSGIFQKVLSSICSSSMYLAIFE